VLKSARIDEALWTRSPRSCPFVAACRKRTVRLKQLVLLFLPKKKCTARGGFKLTDDVRLSIAAQSLPSDSQSAAWTSTNVWVGIVVYPGEFRVRKEETDEHGIVHTFDEELAGEAWPGGPVILSVKTSTDRARYNVVITNSRTRSYGRTGDENSRPRAPEWTREMAQDTRRSLRALLREVVRQGGRPSSTTTPPNTRPNSSPS